MSWIGWVIIGILAFNAILVAIMVGYAIEDERRMKREIELESKIQE